MIRFSPAILVLALSGCAAINANISGEWDCPAQQGRACTTIEDADTLSSRPDFLPAAVSVAPLAPLAPVAPAAQASPVSLLPETDKAETAAPQSIPTDAVTSKAPGVRQTEILGRVWFYPFVDNSDHYHEGGFVHVILRPADWQTSPAHMFPDKGEEQ